MFSRIHLRTAGSANRLSTGMSKKPNTWALVQHVLARGLTLDLRGVQIHRDDVVSARHRQHVGHEFGGDGRARLVLLVLTRVREARDDGRHALG